MDGIDAALLETDGEGNIVELGHINTTYSTTEKIALKATERAIRLNYSSFENAVIDYIQQELCTDANTFLPQIKSRSIADVEQLSTQLHAQAVKKLLAVTGRKAHDMGVIGYHGQTMYHNPTDGVSIQLGDGALLAQLTGIQVVNDFRSNDLANGGQGAPFAPLYHQALAIRDKILPVAVVNCGGIANLTVILGAALDQVMAFDTGPGNGLIDALIRSRTHGKKIMDKDGEYGCQGMVAEAVLETLWEQSIVKQSSNYFLLSPPKSLDIRDMQAMALLEELTLPDAAACLEAFTAETIVRSIDLLGLKQSEIPKLWVLAGGGWHNPVIRNQLQCRLQQKLGAGLVLRMAEELGWNGQALEAQVFAYLAVRSLKALPLSVPKTTGVADPTTGGKLHFPLL